MGQVACFTPLSMRTIFSVPVLISCLLGGLSHTHAQSTWRTDSLMATWSVQHQLDDLRNGTGRGVVRAVDTKDLYVKLQREAPSIPVFADSAVIRYADLYGQPMREQFRVLLGMGNIYFPMIEKELALRELPPDLKYLPMALSAMNTEAGSRTGGSGLWMLTYPVALRYGLVVTANMDERRDDVKSTMVAGRYLKDLHARYQDWGLTIMAFACGPANVTRAQQRSAGATDYRTLYPHFTEDQRDVLPLLMAFIHLTSNAEALGMEAFDIAPWEPTDTISSPYPLLWDALAPVMQLPKARLRAINPSSVGNGIPAGRVFHVPAGMRDRYFMLADPLKNVQEEITNSPKPEPVTVVVNSIVRYKVRSGDNLGAIAEKYHVSVKQLRTWNSLRSDRIDAGKYLVIHQKKRETVIPGAADPLEQSEMDGPSNSTRPVDGTKGSGSIPEHTMDHATYTVQSGDSLYGIAERFPGVSAQLIMEVNGISARIMPGQKLKIPRP